MESSSEHNRPPSGDRELSAQSVYIAMPDSSKSGLDFVELWLIVWRAKWFIVGVTAFFAIASILYALSATPVYRAETILAPVSRNASSTNLSGLGGLAGLAGIRLDTNSDFRHSTAVLQSNDFLGNFILDNNLLPVLFPEEWDAQRQSWKTDDPTLQRDVRDGVRIFKNSVFSVAEDSQSGLLTLAIEWTDPETAAAWATELVKRVNERLRTKDLAESKRKLDYLNKQLGEANLVELRLAISRVIEQQINSMMLAQSQIEFAFDVIDPAVVPKVRVRPKRAIIVIVGTLFGGFMAVFLLLVRLVVNKLASQAAIRTPD